MEEWKFFKFTMVVVGNIIIAIFFIYLYFILQFMIAVRVIQKFIVIKESSFAASILQKIFSTGQNRF